MIEDDLLFENEELADFLEEEKKTVKSLKSLSITIAKFIKKADKKVVLMIDEVDKSSNVKKRVYGFICKGNIKR
jgi:hypothetical protein